MLPCKARPWPWSPLLVALMLALTAQAHQNWNKWRGIHMISHDFANQSGVKVTFEHPVYSNGYFLGYDGWDKVNDKYGVSNVTYIVRLEFKRAGLRDNRIKRHFKRYWLPGAVWVELSTRTQLIHHANLTVAKEKKVSVVDIWVVPQCFLRHNGMTRVHRVAKSLKIYIEFIRWMAKLNFAPEEQYSANELIEIGKRLTKLPGIQCAWIHPPIDSRFSLMVRFFRGEVPMKKFFSPTAGYTNWKSLNNEYQVSAIHFVRGFSRALLDFSGGISFRESHNSIAKRYQSLPGIRSVYLDTLNECRFTYQIVLAFDRKVIDPPTILNYQQWNSLNHIYGVVNVSHQFAHDLKSILEFEAGLYTHQQMKAIRDEYLKLPGIKFGWVTGKRAKEVSTIILNFSKDYLRRLPLRQYHFWQALNKRYNSSITVLEEIKHRAFIRFPEGKYSDLELKAILRRYRQLPGITSVLMDVEHPTQHAQAQSLMWTNSSYLFLPPKKSLASWMKLSNIAKSQFIQPAPDRDINGAKSPTSSTCISYN